MCTLQKIMKVLTVVLFLYCDVGMQAQRINREFVFRSYQYLKKTCLDAAKQVAPMLIAEGIVLAVEMFFSWKRSGAYGNTSRALLNQRPGPVPSSRGMIAPPTVPEPIQRIIRLMNSPEKIVRVGAQMWKAILLVGPAGTGKTELGFYMARQMHCNVIYQSAAHLLGPEQGSGPAAIRTLFNHVYKKSVWAKVKTCFAKMVARIRRRTYFEKPVVLILDELDSIGQCRKDLVSEEDRARENERIRTLEQLLTEIDGAHEQSTLPRLFVVGATNRPLNLLDPALIREGRMRPMHIPPLTQQQRASVLEFHAQRASHPLASDVNFSQLAQATEDFSGAALKGLLNGAALAVAEGESPHVHQDTLLSACSMTYVAHKIGQ